MTVHKGALHVSGVSKWGLGKICKHEIETLEELCFIYKGYSVEKLDEYVEY